MEIPQAVRLPEILRGFFWHADFDAIDLSAHRFAVIEHLLEHGDERAVHWLLQTFSDDTLGEVVRKSRLLSPPTANLWGLALGIPRTEIECFRTPSILRHGAFAKPSAASP